MSAELTLSASYEPPLDLLTGRVLLITGAANGIGRALAIRAAGHGATVVLLDKHVRGLEKVYDEIENNGGPQPAIFPLDLEGADPDHYQQLADTLEQTFGALHGVVHNAANVGKLAPVELYDIETWYRVMQANLSAPFLLTRACLPLLRKSGETSIIFSADRVGRQGRAYWGAYGVSKFGLEGLMQILAHETENTTGVRVNSLDPGAVRTGLRRAAYPGEDANQLPMPEDVVNAFLYLLGPESRHLHGRTLIVGGVTPSAT
jgi:NAD(P)-dependent dehydrogenase (short-subunit alcohol dehydrogenase family)